MGTFYLGFSMAGTVSAGTYTGGTLVEIYKWLDSWQQARTDGTVLNAQKQTANYNIGDPITISPEEVPKHFVKIKSLAGASGGGVSAGLLLAGFSTNKVEEYLRKVWTDVDVREMLNNDDLSNNKAVYSLLNVKPIDDIKNNLMEEIWGNENTAKDRDYLDDNIELFMTLASYEGIPYNVRPSKGNQVTYGVLKTHLDYIKFNFSKNGTPAPNRPNTPFAYNLVYNANHKLKDDNNWVQMLNSCPATAAFPVGFKPRSLQRSRKEYNSKLFYLNYANPTDNFDYATIQPAWPPPTSTEEFFDMEYVDGGTFNREPHDLARASLIESLNLPGKQIPNDGINTNACVILIDPFPSISSLSKPPGSIVSGIPTLFHQPGYLIDAMMDQGRFRPDWIEKAIDDKYYSRFLISPIRRDENGEIQGLSLAAGLLGAFSGFIDVSYREHDYKLGHYNTFQFLSQYFIVPTDNVEVDYCRNITPELKEKYEALGWYKPATAEDPTEYCQIIPRMIEPGLNNSMQKPIWPTITEDKWGEIRALVIERAKQFADAVTDLNWVIDKPVDFIVWHKFLKGRIESVLEGIEKDLVDNKLLRKKS